MTTNPNLESIGVSQIDEQLAPTESKHDLDLKRDEAKLHRREAKELREFNQPMVEFDSNKKLAEALGNPRDIIKKQLKEGNYTTEDKAPYGPYRHVA